MDYLADRAISNTAKKPKKRKRRIFIIAVALLLFLAIFLLIYFNVYGLQDRFLNLVKTGELKTDKAMKDVGNQKQEANAVFEKKNAELLAFERELNELEAALDEKQEELELREKSIAEKEEEIQELYDQLTVETDNLNEVINLYQKMDSESASRILSKIEDVDKVILILKGMKNDKSAEILSLMDAEIATEITNRMLN